MVNNREIIHWRFTILMKNEVHRDKGDEIGVSKLILVLRGHH